LFLNDSPSLGWVEVATKVRLQASVGGLGLGQLLLGDLKLLHLGFEMGH
jgi:hypothetical protein